MAPSYGKLCVKYCVLIDRCITITVIDVTSTPMHGQWLSRSFFANVGGELRHLQETVVLVLSD